MSENWKVERCEGGFMISVELDRELYNHVLRNVSFSGKTMRRKSRLRRLLDDWGGRLSAAWRALRGDY